MLRIAKVIKPWKEAAALNDHINLYGQWSETTVSDQERRRGNGASRRRGRLRKPGQRSPGICGEAS